VGALIFYHLPPTKTLQQLQKVKGDFDFNPDYLTYIANDWHDLERCVREFKNMDEVAEVQSILDYLSENQKNWHLLSMSPQAHPEFAGAPAIDMMPMSWRGLLAISEFNLNIVAANLAAIASGVRGGLLHPSHFWYLLFTLNHCLYRPSDIFSSEAIPL
jgi:hypothetical protein